MPAPPLDPVVRRGLTAARIIESAENYARAHVSNPAPPGVQPRGNGATYLDDGKFWSIVLDGRIAWDAAVFIPEATFSEWVPRVPGLYWRKESAALRRFTPDVIESQSDDGVTLRPTGKSQVVIGGVGTLRLPPNSEGYRLCSVTTSANVSTGVPILVSPDVWKGSKLREGVVLRGESLRWVAMPIEWSSRFPTTRGVPAGCLLATSPADIEVYSSSSSGVQIHPYTIMEYFSDGIELFDFVFATAITTEPNYRGQLETFFDSYRQGAGRQGRYLLSADVANPLWEADYKTPEDLNRAEPAAGSQLKLLERRVRAHQLGDDVWDRTLRALAALPDQDYLRRISTQAGIPPSSWFSGGARMMDAAAQFLARADREQHLPAILEALAIEHPAAA